MAITGVVFLWLTTTSIDIKLADYYYDFERHTFPLKSNWFAYQFNHVILKQTIFAIDTVLIAFLVFDFFIKFKLLSPFLRIRLRLIALTSLAESWVIREMKKMSAQHCPWDVDRYGGDAPYLRLLDHIPTNWSAGHCFPAGHASSSLWLCSLAVLWLPHSPRKAVLAFFAGLAVGFAMGWVQQMRGAHFLTHTLWAAWVASGVLLVIVAIFRKQLFTTPS